MSLEHSSLSILAHENLRPIQSMVVSAFFKNKKLMLSLPRQYGGKTEIGCRLMRDLVGRPFDKSCLFLAKDTKSAKKATREKFMRLFDKKMFEVNTEAVYVKKKPGSICFIGSVDKDPDRLRGGTYAYVHWSEVAFSKIEKGESITDVFQKVVAPTLEMKQGYCLLESTNNGKNGWYDIWEAGPEYGFTRIMISLGQMVEMGLVSVEDYDRIKRETLPLIFRQEYECEWVTFAGAVYEEFSEKHHVFDFPPPKEWQRTIFGIDWGYDPSATCVLLAFKEDGIIYIYDEIYNKKQRTEDTKNEMFARFHAYNVSKFAGVADHEQDRIDELKLAGIPCGKAKKANVLGNRIEIKTLLFEGRMVIHPRCKYLIKDMGAMHWDKKKDGQVDEDLCTWGHYDAEAALRYLIRELGQWEEEEPDEIPALDEDSVRETLRLRRQQM